jgi:hypothetical protein
MSTTNACELMKARAEQSDSGYTFRAVIGTPITAEAAGREILAGLDLLFIPTDKEGEGELPGTVQTFSGSGINGIFAFKADRPDLGKLFAFALYLATGSSDITGIFEGSQEAKLLLDLLAELLVEHKPEQFVEMMTAGGACSRAEAESIAAKIQAQPKKVQ